mmetsp:Transcript_17197/g.28574  ORF Transcript_17197/g.28574 Transcript_17197/m.28574 type:complete len:140 (+) Transcript_17197:80-499(+)
MTNRLLVFVLAFMCLFAPGNSFRPRRSSLVESISRRRLDTPVREQKSFLESHHTSFVESKSLNVRGGGVVGVVGTLLRTAIKNPILVLLMAGTSAITVYKEDVPYAKQLQSFVQLCIVAYMFRMLVQWQKAKEGETSLE